MPLVELQPFVRPEEIVDWFYNDLNDNGAVLGIQYVGAYDEKLSPQYPSVVVSPLPVEKVVHATHTYLYTLRVAFHVMHGDMRQPHIQRNREDMELATRIVDFIERDKTLGGRIIFGFVESEIPGVLGSRTQKGSVIASTRLNWQGISEGRFE